MPGGRKKSGHLGKGRLLRKRQSEGGIPGRHGALPEMAVLEITGHDADGNLLARPLDWARETQPPMIYVEQPKLNPPDRGTRFLARLEARGESYQAHLVRQLERPGERVLGVVRKTSHGLAVTPVDRKGGGRAYALAAHDTAGAKLNELVYAEPVSGKEHGTVRVRVVERIGSLDQASTISLIAIHAHGIPMGFPKKALEEAGSAGPIALENRADLRAISLVTIDPEDARDHDDAVWAGPDEDPANRGGHVVLVAIADVAHYVTPGSALDREALKRGNSTYFPDRVVPMLPDDLSADLCSLKEGVDRPCLAVHMTFDANGHKRGHRFVRGLMRSAARLSYRQAQAAFEGHPGDDMTGPVRKTLAHLWDAYRTLAIAREKRSPLDLDLPERRIRLNAEGRIAGIAFRERLESMRVIEECMVLANVAAAETLERTRTPLIYRVHDRPSKDKLYAFSDFLLTLNIPFAKGQVVAPGTFNRILAKAKGTPYEAVLNDVVLRSQAQAIYHAANIGHFGLNLARYAHFTSPIRRYADLIVHRALIRGLKLPGAGALSDREIRELSRIAEAISQAERRAMAAERDSIDRYVALFMEERVGAAFEARITGVTRFGIFVRIPEFGADGLLPLRALGSDRFHVDERAQAIKGQFSGLAFRLGATVKVKLTEAAPATGGLRFELAQAPTPSRPAASQRRSGKNRFKRRKH
ncbi:MAG: ribonuclease R [Rhizomicrobium sp.]